MKTLSTDEVDDLVVMAESIGYALAVTAMFTKPPGVSSEVIVKMQERLFDAQDGVASMLKRRQDG